MGIDTDLADSISLVLELRTWSTPCLMHSGKYAHHLSCRGAADIRPQVRVMDGRHVMHDQSQTPALQLCG
jgi:hypothetical protein